MILSVSRRTDIPALYSRWFFRRLEAGFVLTPHPRDPNRLSRVPLRPDVVDCLVFWTKNPRPMLDRLDRLRELGYPFYFQYTLTPYGRELEPALPSSAERVATLLALSQRIGPERLIWRYDPVILDAAHPLSFHIAAFDRLCTRLRGHVRHCVFSFMDAYAHARMPAPPKETTLLREAARRLAAVAHAHGLALRSCAEALDLADCGVEPSACIDKNIVEHIVGATLRARPAAGQRPACRCVESVDIGAYDTCAQGCRYCYAVTSETRLRRNRQQHDVDAPLLTGWPTGQERITERAVTSLKTRQLLLPGHPL